MSEAIARFEEPALLHLLRQCRLANERNCITGVLMYGEGQFIQVLEGCPAAVRRLYARIAADPRHGRLEILADGPMRWREFQGWHMSFAPLPAAYPEVPGYLTPPQLVLTAVGVPVQQVLSEFLARSTQAALI
ncbi:BLUF domain-containing protein [Hymenobacter psoromatis]|uniref:BLUF domain-containing protein n=1 Tax=Hymenobacter psoromatis TaxID=1484116 RepID=UPI00300D1CB7